jgi:hypothetical protein
MQRGLSKLTAVALIALISISGSMAFAHGGGGHGGGHSSSHHSGGRSMSRASHNHASHSHHNNTGKSKRNSKSVSNKNKNKNKSKSKGRKGRRHHRRHPYHMHYPVRSSFDGDLDDGDADADAAPGGIDVEFTSIRQLDAGDTSKNLAPAYRVWFHNNSTVDIDQPFDVAILASTDQQLAEGLPYAAVRVDGMAADETTSVDVRLPVEAMSMGGGDQAAPYSFLHTIVDSQRELVETNKANNLSVYAREDIPALEE